MSTPKRIWINLMYILLALTVVLSLFTASAVKAKAHTPKNVIVMIADGRGFNHLLAASYYEAGKEAARAMPDGDPAGTGQADALGRAGWEPRPTERGAGARRPGDFGGAVREAGGGAVGEDGERGD